MWWASVRKPSLCSCPNPFLGLQVKCFDVSNKLPTFFSLLSFGSGCAGGAQVSQPHFRESNINLFPLLPLSLSSLARPQSDLNGRLTKRTLP